MPDVGTESRAGKRRVGVPWYAREDYQRILAVMADAHALAPTYGQWLAAAENNEAEARRAGIEVVRVALDAATFARWCTDRGSPPTRASRVEYVNEAMRRDVGDE
jgi:hypothetical protein